MLQKPEIINPFWEYENNYRGHISIPFEDSFEISPSAVKKKSKIFRSVLKLDKNFHICIDRDTELLEQGIDKDGKKYYKIYYKNET